MIHRSTRRVRSLLLLAGLAGSLTAAGCGTHGKYTQEHINAAEERMSVLKSGTEWDLARQAFLAGDLKKAEKKVDISIAHNNEVTKSHVLRGRIMLEQGRMDQAIASLERALELDEENVDAHYYLALVFERLLQRDTALSYYVEAADLDPNDPQYGVAAAEVMMDMGNVEAAEAFLLSRGDAYRHAAGVRQTLGHIAMIQERPEDAVAMFTEAQLLAPGDNGITEDLIRAQMATARFGEAELALTTLLNDEDFAERRDLQHLRVRCLSALNRPVEARSLLDEMVRGDEGVSDIGAWLALGYVAIELEDQGRLREASRRVISLAPNRGEGHFLRAIWLRQMDRDEQALASAQEAVRLSPENADNHLLLGLVLSSLGQEGEADSSFARAIELDPNNGLARELNGTVVSVPID